MTQALPSTMLAAVSMGEKFVAMWPEAFLFITTCVVMVLGLSKSLPVRRMCAPLAGVGLIGAGLIAAAMTPDTLCPLPSMAMYGKVLAAGIGLVLVCLLAGTVDRDFESDVERTGWFDVIRSKRAEFWAFFLFSLTGLMLTAGADDLILLFLALELTSLPTYVMVAISTRRDRSMEAGVKYFFLGALGAAMFLYGFAFIYGGTGHTGLQDIQREVRAQVDAGGINELTMLGLVLAVVGICFKIAAVPMHFYTPDVYQGSSASMAGYLAFVPKAAGFFAIMLVVSCAGWGFGESRAELPGMLRDVLWIIAVLTMTVGNVLALLQSSVKRILAYSSIAHSGYMLVGVIAGPGLDGRGGEFTRNGLAAVLFYLLSYGVMTVGAFAVLACLERRSRDGEIEEADHVADIRGLCKTHPVLGWIMVVSVVGLLGLPPLLGFFGKLPLFTSAISAGEIPLVVILAINSAIAAYYYLRLAYLCYIDPPETSPNLAPLRATPFGSRRVAGMLSAIGVVVLAVVGGKLADATVTAGRYIPPAGQTQQPERAADDDAPTPEHVVAPH
ncbi:MAG: NADH-quinone oxidoreductase subunit N [Phycisphaerales bacterium]|nr:NADH-quinone oxidoreductase subunit N [Phycisphaerales bacterium]